MEIMGKVYHSARTHTVSPVSPGISFLEMEEEPLNLPMVYSGHTRSSYEDLYSQRFGVELSRNALCRYIVLSSRQLAVGKSLELEPSFLFH